MANMSKYREDANLNWLRGTAFPTAPSTLYLAMFNGDPTDTGTGGTEVTTSLRSAGRIPVTLGAPSAASADAEQVANTAVADFGNAAAGTTYTHFALFDAATGGNLLSSAQVTGSPITVGAGTDVQFPVGSLVLMIA